MELQDILIKIFTKEKTALQLEIDQVVSGFYLYCFIHKKGKSLEEKCNLLDGELNCIYTFLFK